MYAHTRGDIDMQIVELILSKAQTLKVGEVSLIEGKKVQVFSTSAADDEQ